MAASWQRQNEWHVWIIYDATSRSHSTAMDRRRVARFEWGVAWTFTWKTHEIEKSREFKSGEYGSQSAENWNSAKSRWVVLAAQAGAESTKSIFFAKINPLDPQDQMPSQKRLVDAGVIMFTSKNWLAMA